VSRSKRVPIQEISSLVLRSANADFLNTADRDGSTARICQQCGNIAGSLVCSFAARHSHYAFVCIYHSGATSSRGNLIGVAVSARNRMEVGSTRASKNGRALVAESAIAS